MPIKPHRLAGVKEGMVFGIKLRERCYGYLRVFRGSSLAVLPVVTEHLLENVEPLRGILPKWFFFFAAPPGDDTPTFYIGDIPFDDPEQAEPPPCYDPPDLVQSYYRIYERGMFRRASDAEVAGMVRCQNATPTRLREFILSKIEELVKPAASAEPLKPNDTVQPGGVSLSRTPNSPKICMNRDNFWGLIEECHHQGTDCDEQTSMVMARLSQMCPVDIHNFQRHIDECRVESYRWDLWAIAYIINGGCSEDGFEYFRGWLIAQGRSYYEAALTQPERAADRTEPGICNYECEEILFGARRVYQQVTGTPMPETGVRLTREPAGIPWSSTDLKSRYPSLYERYFR